MKKVDFMILGAQKCGTTTLFDILNSHPQLQGCFAKETYFFCSTDDWRKNLHQYEKQFPRDQMGRFFEASTTYTFYPLRNLHIWDDLFDYNSQLKFIYLVRNPLDRIVSSYMHTYERGFTDLSLGECLIKERFLIDISRYYSQILPFIDKFGRDRVLILEFEDLILHRHALMEKVADFLGFDISDLADFSEIHANPSIGGGKKHKRWDHPTLFHKALHRFTPKLWQRITANKSRAFTEKPTLSYDHKEMIIRLLDQEIDNLQKLIGTDLQHWKKI